MSTTSLTWRKEKPSSGKFFPTAREGHSLTALTTLNKILLFGGMSTVANNEAYLYDIESNQWQLQATTGRQPSGRSYHGAFYDEPYFFVYAGQGDKGRSLGDFYVLNTKTWMWKKLFMLETPHFRQNHTINEMRQQEKLIFGGVCLPDGTLLNDLWSVNYSNVAFASNLSEIPGAVWTQLKAKGDIPEPRKGHCSVTVNKSIIVFGGKTAEQEDPSSIFILNYDTLSWKRIISIGKIPTPRSFAAASLFDDKRIFLFGGVDLKSSRALNEAFILSLDDFHWSNPFIAGYHPSGRYNLACCAFPNKKGPNSLYIIGGLDTGYLPMEFYIMEEKETVMQAEWEEAKEPSEMDKLALDIANSTILDQRKYMHDLDSHFNSERLACLQIDREIKKMEEEIESIHGKLENEVQKQEKIVKVVDEEYEKNLQLVEGLFLMIKTEQLLSKEQEHKIALLESFIKDNHNFIVASDKVFQVLAKNTYDVNDSKEKALKQQVDAITPETDRIRDNLTQLMTMTKKNFERVNYYLAKNDQDLAEARNSILSFSKEYENVIFDTETDEQHHFD